MAKVEVVLKDDTLSKCLGLDELNGIPIELYRACRKEPAPALADFFMAIGSLALFQAMETLSWGGRARMLSWTRLLSSAAAS